MSSNPFTIKINFKCHIEDSREVATRIKQKYGFEKGGRLQQHLDSLCLSFCEPYIPRDNGDLIRSGITNSRIGEGYLCWDTPYARRWYYMPANFQEAPKRGNYWFDRMWSENKAKIIKALQEDLKK